MQRSSDNDYFFFQQHNIVLFDGGKSVHTENHVPIYGGATRMLGHAAALEPEAFLTQRILIIIIITFTRHKIFYAHTMRYTLPIHGYLAGVGIANECVIPSCSDTAAGGGHRVVSLWVHSGIQRMRWEITIFRNFLHNIHIMILTWRWRINNIMSYTGWYFLSSNILLDTQLYKIYYYYFFNLLRFSLDNRTIGLRIVLHA